MEVPWRCHGGAMEVPWRCHGGTMEVPREVLGGPWKCHGGATEVPRRCHGGAAEVPRRCNCDSFFCCQDDSSQSPRIIAIYPFLPSSFPASPSLSSFVSLSFPASPYPISALPLSAHCLSLTFSYGDCSLALYEMLPLLPTNPHSKDDLTSEVGCPICCNESKIYQNQPNNGMKTSV